MRVSFGSTVGQGAYGAVADELHAHHHGDQHGDDGQHHRGIETLVSVADRHVAEAAGAHRIAIARQAAGDCRADAEHGGDGGNGNGIGVNSFLWRASLDTTSFMPLASADPFGGVIITDWYTAPEAPAERFKMTIYILDTRLRADGVKVSVFKQQQTPDGAGWADAAVTPGTSAQLENAILIRARQLRIDTLAAEE